jgi:predicted LPLAT superfamily acyltransferase
MTHWSKQTERTNLFWLSVLSYSATVLGRGFLAALCLPIAFFFLLTATEPRRMSRDYLARVLPQKPRWWHIFKHFYTFARVSSDRLLFLSGRTEKFDLEFHGAELVQEYARQGQGCLLLVSHIGSFDAMRVPAVEEEKIPIRILIDKQHNRAATQILEKLNPTLAEGMIDADMGPSELALSVHDALKKGDMVGIMADRPAPTESVRALEFLNQPANFPTGPWKLAMALKVPVILCFAIYKGGNRYQVQFCKASDGAPTIRAERLHKLEEQMQFYVQKLQYFTRENPYNWFNFYDFWSDASTFNK